jgi:uncharacterized protein
MLSRSGHLDEVLQDLRRSPIVGILGARQVGKTTLALQVSDRMAGHAGTHWFDLEDPDALAALAEPKLALAGLKGLVVLDEIQRRPDLFPLLRVLADRPDAPASFLILGSASPDLLRQSSESLAGRVAYHLLDGFNPLEVPADQTQALWLRGGFPRSFLADNDSDSLSWRRDFISQFLERDVPGLGFRISAEHLRRFWSMLAHSHAQILDQSGLARALAVSEPTIRRYLDLLSDTFMVRQLKPWHENLTKRQVRRPKIYIKDSGLLHALLGIRDGEDLPRHPTVGASWEGFALEASLHALKARPEEAYFWATHQGTELDLFVTRGDSRLGLEFKRTSSPALTPSMRHALEDLKLDRLIVVHGGDRRITLAKRIEAVPLAELEQTLKGA